MGIFFTVSGGEPIRDNLEIFLLIGQSNMAGRAEIESQDRDTLKNVFLFTGIPGKEWENAANPLNKYSTVRKDISMQKLGPGYTFAKQVAEALHGKQIGLVVNCKGGTRINEWLPGTTLFNQAVLRTKMAMKHGTIRGIIWQQGQSDVVRENFFDINTQDAYMQKLITIINELRLELGTPDLPFVASQCADAVEGDVAFNKMISHLPEKLESTRVVNTNNTYIFDKYHFDSKSQRLMGKRFAEEMLKLINK